MTSLEGGADKSPAGYRPLIPGGQPAFETTGITAEDWLDDADQQSADRAYGAADLDITATEEDDQEDHPVEAAYAGVAAVQESIAPGELFGAPESSPQAREGDAPDDGDASAATAAEHRPAEQEQPATEPEPPEAAEQAPPADTPASQAPAPADGGDKSPPPPLDRPMPSASGEEPPEGANDNDPQVPLPATEPDVADAESSADASGADDFTEQDEPEVASSAPLPEPPKPLADRIRGWFSRDKPASAADETAAGSSDAHEAQDPDGPYAQEDLVRHPVTGEMTPAADILDMAHTAIRMAEIADQADNPRPPEVRIPRREVPQHAAELLSSVQDAVADWAPGREVINPESGEVVRNYNMTVAGKEANSRPTFYTVQLVYKDDASAVPVYGNVSVTVPTRGWMREYYFQAEPVARERGDKPTVYYNDYPFHEETLGRPQTNTVYGLEQARRLASILPKGPQPDADQHNE